MGLMNFEVWDMHCVIGKPRLQTEPGSSVQWPDMNNCTELVLRMN